MIVIFCIVGINIFNYHLIRPFGQKRNPKYMAIIPKYENNTSVKISIYMGGSYFDYLGLSNEDINVNSMKKYGCKIVFEINNSVYLDIPEYFEQGNIIWDSPNEFIYPYKDTAEIVYKNGTIDDPFHLSGYFIDASDLQINETLEFAGYFDEMVTQPTREKFILELFTIGVDEFGKELNIDIDVYFDELDFYEKGYEIEETNGELSFYFIGAPVISNFITNIFSMDHLDRIFYNIPVLIEYTKRSSRNIEFFGNLLIGLLLPFEITILLKVLNFNEKNKTKDTKVKQNYIQVCYISTKSVTH